MSYEGKSLIVYKRTDYMMNTYYILFGLPCVKHCIVKTKVLRNLINKMPDDRNEFYISNEGMRLYRRYH